MVRIFLAICLMTFIALPAAAMQSGIAIVVNEDAISMNDLNDRMRLVMASSRLPDKPEVRAQISSQVVGALIDEQLKMQEAKRLDIEVTREEIANGFATIAGQNKLSPDEFRAMLKSGGVNVATMERQVESQIAWSKVVQIDLRAKVTITDNDVANVVERYTNNLGKTEYLVAEIVLAVPTAKDDAKVKTLAGELIAQARSGKAPFFRLAQQFSSAPGAPKGGNLGWVQEGQLADDLDAVLVHMNKATISEPIRSPAGYHILALRDKRVVDQSSIPPEQEIRNTLGLERLERLQQRRLMDLKSAAFIESRLSQ
ncbi:MAG: peptidylprolyl isomerase [Alphaproteobacteria bacterium]